MNNHNLLVLAVIGALYVIFPLANSRQNDDALLKTYNIYIIDDLPGDGYMSLHCKSSDDDLGTHLLVPHQVYHFGTKIDVFRTTMFSCEIKWEGKDQTYPAFKARRDETRCSKYCLWSVRYDGIYFSKDNSTFYNAFPW